MKNLTLICDCGATQTFRGADAADIMRQIDAANWEDQAWREDELPKGQCRGECPQCLAKSQA